MRTLKRSAKQTTLMGTDLNYFSLMICLSCEGMKPLGLVLFISRELKLRGLTGILPEVLLGVEASSR